MTPLYWRGSLRIDQCHGRHTMAYLPFDVPQLSSGYFIAVDLNWVHYLKFRCVHTSGKHFNATFQTNTLSHSPYGNEKGLPVTMYDEDKAAEAAMLTGSSTCRSSILLS